LAQLNHNDIRRDLRAIPNRPRSQQEDGYVTTWSDSDTHEAVSVREGDWLGIITMAIGLAALQTVLEEGNKKDWFGSPFIVRLSIIAAIALTLFLVIELNAKKPLLNLRLVFGRNFGFGLFANFPLGVALNGSVYILPAYLSRIQGYNAEQIGLVLAWTGLPQLVLIPFVPRFAGRRGALAPRPRRSTVAAGWSKRPRGSSQTCWDVAPVPWTSSE
jgi:hypothetical protein